MERGFKTFVKKCFATPCTTWQIWKWYISVFLGFFVGSLHKNSPKKEDSPTQENHLNVKTRYQQWSLTYTYNKHILLFMGSTWSWCMIGELMWFPEEWLGTTVLLDKSWKMWKKDFVSQIGFMKWANFNFNINRIWSRPRVN